MSNPTVRLSGGSVDIDAYAEAEFIAQALAGQRVRRRGQGDT